MNDPIVHVVRDFGGLTEPFIAHRVGVGLAEAPARLWYERARATVPSGSTQVEIPILSPGGYGDRLFHQIPQIGPRLAGAYRRRERVEHPRLIHAHYATSGYLVGSVTRSPLVVGAYGFDISTMPRRVSWARALRRLAHRADRIIVEGPHMREVVRRLGFPDDRIRIVPIATDAIDVTQIDRDLAAEADAPVRLVACGRLIPKKGHELALRAFAQVRDHLPPGSGLEVIGSGPLAGHLSAVAAELGVGDSVTFAGALPGPVFRAHLAAATMFLAPSVTAANGDSEGGAPTTILDAQASGTVVVGSRHADIPYLIEEGVTGWLAEEGDVRSLAETIRRALADRAIWPSVRASALEQVASRHAPEAVAEALRAVYRELIG